MIKITDLYFVAQRIYDFNNLERIEYELLLRSKSERGFPTVAYEILINDNELHYEYLNHLLELIEKIIDLHPDMKFSFNIDQQELEYLETLETLAQASKKVKENLRIEITENAPTQRKSSYFVGFNTDAIKEIYNIGFEVVFDDLGVGNNSLGNLLKIKDYVYRIKWSRVHFENTMNESEIRIMAEFIAKISHRTGMKVVIEGIENEEFSNWLVKHDVMLQQGFYLDRPITIAEIK